MAPQFPASVGIHFPQSFLFSDTVLQPADNSATNGASTQAADSKNGAGAQSSELSSVLDNFQGTFSGPGFNNIFRPHSTNKATPTTLGIDPSLNPANGQPDNILQLNITHETQTFNKMPGKVPNRGLLGQEDIFLDGWSYTQSITDVTDPKEGTPVIHFEPGLWLSVPPSTSPKLATSLTRMGSIPHGTTINAQCFKAPVTAKGAPNIATVDITPFVVGGNQKIDFRSQVATNNDTFRLPQDLTPFIKDGTITQEIISNPNTVLVAANKGKDIVENTTFTVSTKPSAPEEGGGTSNIGFLIGNDATKGGNGNGNANAAKVTATYWISTVRTKIDLKPFKPSTAQPSTTFSPAPLHPNDVVPVFSVNFEIPSAKTVNVTYKQIQYSQNVLLDFKGLSWPHVTVATLTPTDPQPLEASILKQ